MAILLFRPNYVKMQKKKKCQVAFNLIASKGEE